MLGPCTWPHEHRERCNVVAVTIHVSPEGEARRACVWHEAYGRAMGYRPSKAPTTRRVAP